MEKNDQETHSESEINSRKPNHITHNFELRIARPKINPMSTLKTIQQKQKSKNRNSNNNTAKRKKQPTIVGNVCICFLVKVMYND